MMTEAGNRVLLLLVMTTYCIWGTAAQVQFDLCPETCVDRTCQDTENNTLICTHGCVNGYWGDRCNNECPVTCVDQTCHGKSWGLLFICTHGCEDGHWGDKCYNVCPVNCATCHRQFGASGGQRECYTCTDGFYANDTDTECTLACLPQCHACNSESDCTSCTDGYFLDNTQCQPCPPRCTVCSSNTDCSACNLGYYHINQGCQLCPTGCSVCSSNIDCSACNHGYHHINAGCQQCPPRCTQCTSDNVCTECASEYYTGLLCDECVDGRLGNMCESVQSSLCPETCVERTCEDNNQRRCTYGCVDGFWGTKCYEECPSRCAQCHRRFGDKRECYECQKGYYVTDTYMECSLSCNPHCQSCTAADLCQSCNHGYYNSETVTNCSLTTTPASKADDSISVGTIAGLAVGGTIGLAVVVMFIVIIVLMYRRPTPSRQEDRNATQDDVIPRNIYDDLNMTDRPRGDGDYDVLDQETGNIGNKVTTDTTDSHQYENAVI